MDYQLAFNILLLIVGFFILIRSSVFVVRSLVNLAHFLNVSEFTLSFILMAFATTLPEFGIGLSSAITGNSSLALGNVLGTNIFNLSLILGVIVLTSGKLPINSQIAAHRPIFNFILATSPMIFLIDGYLSRLDGLMLIIIFFLHLIRLFHLKSLFHHHRSFWLSFINHFEHPGGGMDLKYFFKNFFIFIISVGLLLLSAFLVVKGGGAIASQIGISQMLIGVFIVAIGTSLPELVFGLRAVFSNNESLSLGNLFGATIFNSTWILGLVAFISPIRIQEINSFLISAVVMALVLLLANLFLTTQKAISRREGVLLVLIYVIFIIIQLSTTVSL